MQALASTVLHPPAKTDILIPQTVLITRDLTAAVFSWEEAAGERVESESATVKLSLNTYRKPRDYKLIKQSRSQDKFDFLQEENHIFTRVHLGD